VDEPLTIRIIDSRDSDLAEDDRAVRGGRAPAFDEVVLDREACQLVVAQARRARPHFGLVLVPVVPRFDDLGFDGAQDGVEGLDRVFSWGVGSIEVELFGGG
jgi:hypothetical protein